MRMRFVDYREKTVRHRITDLVISAVTVTVLGYVATTTLRPVFYNAAATNAELRGDSAAAERYLIAATVQARRFNVRGSLTIAVERLADLYWKAERYPESEQQLLQLMALRELRLGSRHQLVAEVLDRLGLAAQQQGRMDEAESYLRRSLEIREDVAGPRHIHTARSLLRLGNLYRVSRETKRADLYLSRALTIVEDQTAPTATLSQLFPGLGAQGTDASNRRVLTEVLYELSSVRSRQDRLPEAEMLAERALALARELALPPQFEAATLSQLGGLHQSMGETDAALAYHREARALVERHGLHGSRLDAALLNNLALSQAASGRAAHASVSLDQARHILDGRLSEQSPLSLIISSNEERLDVAP